MREEKKTEVPGLDIAGLLTLKKFERPESARTEKNIQNIMRTVRTTNNIPSLLLFPDKSFAWMFAQPRYGIAALFVIFLGMSLMDRPATSATASTSPVIKVPRAEAIMAAIDTNQLKSVSVPGIAPAFSVAGDPEPLSSYIK